MVITTAAVPQARRAVMVTESMVLGMAGAVIVDMASDSGETAS